MRVHCVRYVFLALGLLSLATACGRPRPVVSAGARAPGGGRSLVPAPPSTPTPTGRPPTRWLTPTPTHPPGALPAASPSPAAPPPVTNDPFAFLTALALTPTVPPQPLSRPQRLTIPAIALDAPVYPVGQDAQGNPVVLPHDVAWYDRSGKPGAGTNIVFWAHVLRFKAAPARPAPFAEVHKLHPGDRITVTTGGNTRRDYVVTAQVRVRPD